MTDLLLIFFSIIDFFFFFRIFQAETFSEDGSEPSFQEEEEEFIKEANGEEEDQKYNDELWKFSSFNIKSSVLVRAYFCSL